MLSGHLCLLEIQGTVVHLSLGCRRSPRLPAMDLGRPKGVGLNDLVLLGNATDASVTGNLQQRYMEDYIYVRQRPSPADRAQRRSDCRPLTRPTSAPC